VNKGVPPAAARDFVLGHLRIQIAVLFNEVNGTFSDAAYKISRRARPVLFREDWPNRKKDASANSGQDRFA
jgi:D-apionate oxidoisomerase